MEERIEELALFLELYYESGRVSILVSTELLGNAYGLGFNDGLFGKLTRLDKVIKKRVHPSWNESDKDDDYYQMIQSSELSWEDKAKLLMEERRYWNGGVTNDD